SLYRLSSFLLLFFFSPSSPTLIYTLSLHDALPISSQNLSWLNRPIPSRNASSSALVEILDSRDLSVTTLEIFSSRRLLVRPRSEDRKSTRLNSSHLVISYAVFCLKKKNKQTTVYHT